MKLPRRDVRPLWLFMLVALSVALLVGGFICLGASEDFNRAWEVFMKALGGDMDAMQDLSQIQCVWKLPFGKSQYFITSLQDYFVPSLVTALLAAGLAFWIKRDR